MLVPGSRVEETLTFNDNLDSFEVFLESGITYQFNVFGRATGDGSLDDPVLAVEGPGDFFRFDDDGGDGLNARLVTMPFFSGLHVVMVSGSDSRPSGSYEFAFDVDPSMFVPTIDATSMVSREIPLFGDRVVDTVNLTAGFAYIIDAQPAETETPLEDPILRLFDTGVELVASDDDGGDGFSSRLIFAPDQDGTFFISVGSFDDFGTGDYDLSIEERASFSGSSRDDSLRGTIGDDAIVGLAGNDLIDGNAGADLLLGGPGNDTYIVTEAGDIVVENPDEGFDRINLFVNAGRFTAPDHVEQVVLQAGVIEAVAATTGTKLVGLGDDNVFFSGNGTDFFDGNDGTDTLSYELAESSVEASLLKPTAFNTGGAGTDKIDDIENLIGSDFSDVLVGAQGVSNIIDGGRGNDLIVGFAGPDRLIGGSGVDTFSYNSLGFRDSLNGGGEDTIVDFELGTDEIDLSRLGVTLVDIDFSPGRLEADVTDAPGAEFAINFENNVRLNAEDVIV